jgi:hypothetical protein
MTSRKIWYPLPPSSGFLLLRLKYYRHKILDTLTNPNVIQSVKNLLSNELLIGYILSFIYSQIYVQMCWHVLVDLNF